MDLFKRRCGHNRILGPLENCELCVQSARQRALAKAGPEQSAHQQRVERVAARVFDILSTGKPGVIQATAPGSAIAISVGGGASGGSGHSLGNGQYAVVMGSGGPSGGSGQTTKPPPRFTDEASPLDSNGSVYRVRGNDLLLRCGINGPEVLSPQIAALPALTKSMRECAPPGEYSRVDAIRICGDWLTKAVRRLLPSDLNGGRMEVLSVDDELMAEHVFGPDLFGSDEIYRVRACESFVLDFDLTATAKTVRFLRSDGAIALECGPVEVFGTTSICYGHRHSFSGLVMDKAWTMLKPPAAKAVTTQLVPERKFEPPADQWFRYGLGEGSVLQLPERGVKLVRLVSGEVSHSSSSKPLLPGITWRIVGVFECRGLAPQSVVEFCYVHEEG